MNYQANMLVINNQNEYLGKHYQFHIDKNANHHIIKVIDYRKNQALVYRSIRELVNTLKNTSRYDFSTSNQDDVKALYEFLKIK